MATWLHVNGKGYEAARPDVTILYEELLADPIVIIADLAEATGETFPGTIVNAYVKRISAVSGVHEAAHQTRWTMPHGEHDGRWRTEMNFDEVVSATRALGTLPGEFGYRLPGIAE